MIDLYTAATPNGKKIVIMLEELGLQYKKHMVDLKALEQKSPEFLSMNPNGRIPVIVDHEGPNGQKTTVFESGAILYYLAEKNGGKFFGANLTEKAHCLQWVMFQMSAIGPNFGNYHYGKYFMEKQVPEFIERFEKESKRLITVLNSQLTKHTYVAGDNYTIADITTYTWVSGFAQNNADWFMEAPAIRRWLALVGERPAVQKGMA